MKKIHAFGLVVIIFSLYIDLISAQLLGCNANPCQNNGVCVEQPNTLYGYSCSCKGEFKGMNCQYEANFNQKIIVGGASGDIHQPATIIINAHDSQPDDLNNNNLKFDVQVNRCLNGGHQTAPNQPCQCKPGYSGINCEVINNPYQETNSLSTSGVCASYPCRNNGRCRPTLLGYECDCVANFFGSRCEFLRPFADFHFNRVIGISLGTILSVLLCCCLIGLCVYCCIANRKYMSNGSANFMGRDLMDRFSGRRRNPCPDGYIPANSTIYTTTTVQQSRPLMDEETIHVTTSPYRETVIPVRRD